MPVPLQCAFAFLFSLTAPPASEKCVCLSSSGLPWKNTVEDGCVNNGDLMVIILEAGKSKIKTLRGSVSGENRHSGSEINAFSLCPHMTERMREGSLGSLCKDTNSIHYSSRPMTQSHPEASPPNTITLRVRNSTYKFWEGTNIQAITLIILAFAGKKTD